VLALTLSRKSVIKGRTEKKVLLLSTARSTKEMRMNERRIKRASKSESDTGVKTNFSFFRAVEQKREKEELINEWKFKFHRAQQKKI
jgi:hypothetical protein